MLGRVGMARAEGHREAGEHQRDDEREVAEASEPSGRAAPVLPPKKTESEDETAFSCRAM